MPGVGPPQTLVMMRRSLWRLAEAVTALSIEAKLKACPTLAPVASVAVQDISGGCGSFFKVEVASDAFQGKSLVQQHRMVHATLSKEIAEIHGITVVSKIPPKSE